MSTESLVRSSRPPKGEVRGIVTESASLRQSFCALLEASSTLHLAVAWMRSGWALDEICNSGVAVRAVIGTNFGMTEPAAIKQLMCCNNSCVRVVDRRDGSGIFHPKLYLFSKGRSGAAIIGSMNLTRAAFSINEELGVVLTLDTKHRAQLLATWEGWKESATEPTARWLQSYQKWWDSRPRRDVRSLGLVEDVDTVRSEDSLNITRHEVLNYSWRSYEKLLRAHAKERCVTHDCIADASNSYLATIRMVHPILNGPLPTPSTTDFRRLMGQPPTADDPQQFCGWLGNLGASGKTVAALGRNTRLRQRVESSIPALLRAGNAPEALLETSKRLWDAMTSVPHVSHAAVTRLCAIARPDAFFSLNQRSAKVLAELLGVPRSRLTSWDGYASGLRAFWASPWWNSPQPAQKGSREMWKSRVALIDVLAYTARN